jgi:hypothetical protein
LILASALTATHLFNPSEREAEKKMASLLAALLRSDESEDRWSSSL